MLDRQSCQWYPPPLLEEYPQLTPQFKLDTAELRLAELQDERAALVAHQTTDRHQRLQALSVKHKAEHSKLVAQQQSERIELTQLINEQHTQAKQDLHSRLSATKDAVRLAKRELSKQ